MGIGAYLILTVLSCVAGIGINKRCKAKYNHYATAWWPFAFQTFFLVASWFTKPSGVLSNESGRASSLRFFIWVALTILAFLVGIVMCWRQAESFGASNDDKYLAVLSQILLPIGATLLIIGVFFLLGAAQDPNKKGKKNTQKSKVGQTDAFGRKIIYDNGARHIVEDRYGRQELIENNKAIASFSPKQNRTMKSGGYTYHGNALKDLAEK